MTNKYLVKLFMYQPIDNTDQIKGIKLLVELFGVDLRVSANMYEAMEYGDYVELIITADQYMRYKLHDFSQYKTDTYYLELEIFDNEIKIMPYNSQIIDISDAFQH
jgi:hypothetical protein